MMGKKKAQKVMQEGSGTSFLAGQVQPSPAPSEVSGIQQTEQKQVKTEKQEELKPIENMSLEELEKTINDTINKYKEFYDIMVKIKEFIPFLEKIAKYYLKWTSEDFQYYYEKFLKSGRDAFEIYLNKLSLAYSKKKFNIQI
jgi:hypothetical protein